MCGAAAEQLEEDQQRYSGLLQQCPPPLARFLQSPRPLPHRSGSNSSILPFRHVFIHWCPHSPVPPPANEGSKADMARLLQLVLGISINCERKESKYKTHVSLTHPQSLFQSLTVTLRPSLLAPAYIQDIMAMQEDSQHIIMAAIQEVRV